MKFLICCLVCITHLVFYSCTDNDVSNENQTENLSRNVQLVRDLNSKEATFNITNTNQNWKLYAGNSISSIDKSKSLLEGAGSGSYKLSISNTVRSYFELVTPTENIYFAENHLPITGGYNFRDLGGIKTEDNKTVKWGKLIRSGKLSSLTDADLIYLSSIPLTSQVDFRSDQESEAAPNIKPNSLKNIYELPISFGNLNYDITTLDPTKVDSILIRQNIQLVSDSSAIAMFKEFFRVLQDENNLPLIFNCTAGKDRTGMATALILYSLGVNEKVIFENYLESNIYIEGKYIDYVSKYPFLKPLFEVRIEYLGAGIDYIKKNYKSVDNYLVQVLNVDLAKMKQIYLY